MIGDLWRALKVYHLSMENIAHLLFILPLTTVVLLSDFDELALVTETNEIMLYSTAQQVEYCLYVCVCMRLNMNR